MQPNVPSDWGGASFSIRFWSVVAVTGVGAGLGAAALMAILHTVQHISYSYSGGPFQIGVEHSSDLRRVLVLAAAGLFAGVAWFLLRRLSGHSVTGLSEAIWERAGRMPFLESIANALFQILIVAMGASLGREGAPKEAGAAVASKLSSWAKLTDSQRRLLVACGAGAGMAAVYNVPLGGALFALEVLLGTISLPLVLPALATSLIATAVAWIYIPDRPTYTIQGHSTSVQLIVWALIFGPLAGLIAVGYIRLVAWANHHKPQGWKLVASTTVVFTALGAVAIAYPQVLGNGRDIAQLALVAKVSFPLLLALVFLKPLATVGCLRSGAKGGLFTPTLAFGTLLGGLSGDIWAHIWPGVPVASCAIIGAAAVLAATMQGPISSVVLVLELTDHGLSLMVPLLLAVASATLVCRLLEDRSIYSAPLRRDPQPPGGPEPNPA